MQTILGSGGAIGTELAKALKRDFTSDIRLVSRGPEKINSTDQIHAADITVVNELRQAIEGSEIVYVTVGFPYSYKIWSEKWPPFIKNLIEACKGEKCKLVFFDNIYMYDPNYLNEMTEETPVNPSSKKGRIRAEIARMIMDNAKAGNIRALIARSADFYGPSIQNTSVLTQTVFEPLSKGKKANWLMSTQFKHSYTYTPDAGTATAILGNTDNAYNQIWHLPTASNPLTGKEWIREIAGALNTKARYQVANRFIVNIMGLFNPIMNEMKEMLYQYDRDYVFNSDKFQSTFNYQPIPYLQGIKEIVKSDYS